MPDHVNSQTKRQELFQRLLKAVAHLPPDKRVATVTNHMTYGELERLVKYLERI